MVVMVVVAVVVAEVVTVMVAVVAVVVVTVVTVLRTAVPQQRAARRLHDGSMWWGTRWTSVRFVCKASCATCS
jgi:hypothetical protein